MRLRGLGSSVAIAACLALLPASAASAAPRGPAGIGYDVSYPQCGGPLPSNPAFGILGVSDGLAYGTNDCLASQYAWASAAGRPAPAFYMNTGNPGTAATRVSWYEQTGPRPCSPTDEAACAYDYGYNGAAQALRNAHDQTGATTGSWWLDVETSNSWSADTALNLADVQGSIDYLTGQGVAVGVYSTGYQWGVITGGARLPVPAWVAGAANAKRAAVTCTASFTGGKVLLVQYPSGAFDADYACAG